MSGGPRIFLLGLAVSAVLTAFLWWLTGGRALVLLLLFLPLGLLARRGR